MREDNLAQNNWIYTYYQGIKNGKYCVGQYIILLYDYLIKGLQEKQFFYDAKKANDAIRWKEEHCFHTEGPLAPTPLKMEVWQKAKTAAIYGIVDKNGNRQFREVFEVIGRKNGKSLESASDSCYIWRNGGFGTRVICLAPKTDQADIVYNCIWQMVQLDPEWKELKEKSLVKDAQHRKVHDDSMLARHRMSDLAIPGSNSTVKKVSYMSRDLNGYNPSLAICDEVASWSGDKGLKAYEVIKSAMGARPDGLLISCTTAGYVNDSVYDELMKRSTRFLLGDSNEKRLLPFLYIIDDIEKWNDINELQKSNPNLGVSVTVDYMLEEIAIAEGSLSKRAEFLTKYCNVKQNSSLAWLPANIVEAASGEHIDLEDLRETYCVGGIDLSQTRDLTAACIVVEKNEELYVVCHFWLPAEKIDEAQQRDGIPYNIYIQRGILSPSGDNFVDYHDCYNWFTDLIEKYQIYPLQIGYDRYSADYLTQELKQRGFHMDDVFQGENLYPVIQETQGLLEDRKIHIGDNDLLKAHMLNSAIKMSTERGRGKLVKLAPSLHIDGTAALLDAMCVRQKYHAELGDQLKNGTL